MTADSAMAEVLPPSATPLPPSPTPQLEESLEDKTAEPSQISSSNDSKAQPRERIPSYAQSRMSAYSQRSSRSRSRPQSTATTYNQYHSSLPYAIVRDFAYPSFHPMHHGPPPDSQSGTTTPGSDWNSGRRLSDSAEGWSSNASRFAGPWGGDGGVRYGEGEQPETMEPLPATAFGNFSDDDLGDIDPPFRRGHHRKSRSYANIEDFERGRHRNSGGGHAHRKAADSADMYYFSTTQGSQFSDPAGRQSLRQSRGYDGTGSVRRDSHFASTLPSRSFHTAQAVDPDSDMPLDAEYSTHSPQRESMGPEDEELYAGESLALYGFEPENPNELRLVEGQVVIVSYRHGQGWLVASDPTTGEQGLVPEAYVRLVKHIENWDHERGGFIEDQEEDEEEEEEDKDSQSPVSPIEPSEWGGAVDTIRGAS